MLQRVKSRDYVDMRFAGVFWAAALAGTAATQSVAQEAPRRADRLEAGVIHLAQLFPRPPREVPLIDDDPQVIPAQDNGGLVLRIDRLEGQLRALTGQIEQMQNQQRKLEEALRKFQQDVDFRLQDGGRRPPGPKRTDGAEAAPGAAGPTAGRARRPGGSDVFDPTLDPNAPGAPKTIGALPSGPILLEDPGPNAPIEINKNGPSQTATIGVAPPATPLNDYDQAVALFRQGQFETAEGSFRTYLQKNPAGRLTPDAIFFLGETYFQRQRHREAAEQYLKLSTDFAKANRAPDGLVKLGMSLNALGAREQACAAFAEVPRKYPAATVAIRGADREAKRAHC